MEIGSKLQNARNEKRLTQEQSAEMHGVSRQTISKWEQGLSVPDAEMLISISEELETPVSELLGENISETKVDDLKVISEKLEIINLQLSQRKNERRKVILWILILLCTIIIIISIFLFFLNSPYLNWNYNKAEYAVLGVSFHSFEWLFIRIAPLMLIGLIIGSFLTRKKK